MYVFASVTTRKPIRAFARTCWTCGPTEMNRIRTVPRSTGAETFPARSIVRSVTLYRPGGSPVPNQRATPVSA